MVGEATAAAELDALHAASAVTLVVERREKGHWATSAVHRTKSELVGARQSDESKAVTNHHGIGSSMCRISETARPA